MWSYLPHFSLLRNITAQGEQYICAIIRNLQDVWWITFTWLFSCRDQAVWEKCLSGNFCFVQTEDGKTVEVCHESLSNPTGVNIKKSIICCSFPGQFQRYWCGTRSWFTIRTSCSLQVCVHVLLDEKSEKALNCIGLVCKWQAYDKCWRGKHANAPFSHKQGRDRVLNWSCTKQH